MKITKFEDIVSWQKARYLTIVTYSKFKNNRDYSFRDQIQRAAISIMNNIAEGFERQSNKEFRNFLYISKGSCGEFRSMLYVAVELMYITQEDFLELYTISTDISKLLSGLIKIL